MYNWKNDKRLRISASIKDKPMSMSLAHSRKWAEKKVTPYREKGCRLLERPAKSKTQISIQHRQKYTGRLYTMIQL